jgi:hypothetical protein
MEAGSAGQRAWEVRGPAVVLALLLMVVLVLLLMVVLVLG